jgi:hypothetical protein
VRRAGLVPYCAKDIKIGFSTINARTDKVGSHLGARVPDKVPRPVLATILVIVGVRMLRA